MPSQGRVPGYQIVLLKPTPSKMGPEDSSNSPKIVILVVRPVFQHIQVGNFAMNHAEMTRKTETAAHKEIFTSYPTKHLSIYTEYPRDKSTEGDQVISDDSRTEEATVSEQKANDV